jgi:hypothetical protein
MDRILYHHWCTNVLECNLKNDSLSQDNDNMSVGTGADPKFNATTTHQQNPNYQPFRQHLQSR